MKIIVHNLKEHSMHSFYIVCYLDFKNNFFAFFYENKYAYIICLLNCKNKYDFSY